MCMLWDKQFWLSIYSQGVIQRLEQVEKLKAELAARLNKTALKKKMARDKVKNAGLKARRAYMAKVGKS